MTGIGTMTGQALARAALVQACRTALDGEPVDIGSGFRWPLQHPDWVYATSTESRISQESIKARRALDEEITLTLNIGAWRGGDDQEAEDAAFGRAFDLLGRIQHYIHTQDPTLGGAVLICVPASSESDGATLKDDTGLGRLIEIAATFVCRYRINATP